MNKRLYNFGNPFKVKFREHYCYKCGTNLSIVKDSKVVSQNSEEAQYYDFTLGGEGVMIGPCEFIHKVFHCPKCSENIEFITQLNLEDIDIIAFKVKQYFYKKGIKLTINKCFENEEGVVEDKIKNIEQIKFLCLNIKEFGKDPLVYKIPISRKKSWERPYYFKVSKKAIIEFFKSNRISEI